MPAGEGVPPRGPGRFAPSAVGAPPPIGLQARLLATMSHELRTPLSVVIGFSEALIREAQAPGPDGPIGGERVAEFGRAINAAGRELLTLVDVVIDVSRVAAAETDLPSNLVQVCHLVDAVVRDLDGAARAGGLSFAVRCAADLPMLRGDERRLHHALRQIVDERGEVHARRRRDRDIGRARSPPPAICWSASATPGSASPATTCSARSSRSCNWTAAMRAVSPAAASAYMPVTSSPARMAAT